MSANTSFTHAHSRPLAVCAQEADLLVVVAGLKTIESMDRESLRLLRTDEELIRQASLLKPTVAPWCESLLVCVFTSRPRGTNQQPLSVSPFEPNAECRAHATYCGLGHTYVIWAGYILHPPLT